MKYVSITFDDGREDNYSVAYPIMKKYGFTATLFCTTGFIDGSWPKKKDWYSAGKAISFEQLLELKNNGWEIALHGDRHQTEVQDTLLSISKMKRGGGVLDSSAGFSVPDSRVLDSDMEKFILELVPNKIKYIRKGRAIDTRKLTAKLLFGIYSLLGCQWAYNRFNKRNVIPVEKLSFTSLNSIVIRNEDRPEMVYRFIERAPDNTVIILMFHSILSKDNPLYGMDPWNWEDAKFDKFLSCLQKIRDNKEIEIVNIESLVDSVKEGRVQ